MRRFECMRHYDDDALMKNIHWEYRSGQITPRGAVLNLLCTNSARSWGLQIDDGVKAERKHPGSQRIWDQRDLRQDERRICHDGVMTEAADNPLESYVRAALALQGYTFDETQLAEIVLQFARLEAIAQTVFDWPLPFGSEAAPVFHA